jgi:hypothetical protein
VNGPEVLDKYVGGSEEKIRALFADAEKEQVMNVIRTLLVYKHEELCNKCYHVHSS